MLLTDAQGNRYIGTPIKYRDEPGQPKLSLPDLDEHGPTIRAEAKRRTLP
jgi:hypothetical protein